MNNTSEIYNSINLFIERGNKIKEPNEKEDNELANQGIVPLLDIQGSEYLIWLNEINTFSSRHLKKHPFIKAFRIVIFSERQKVILSKR